MPKWMLGCYRCSGVQRFAWRSCQRLAAGCVLWCQQPFWHESLHMFQVGGFLFDHVCCAIENIRLWYCWWLKSCITWDVANPVNNGIKTTNLNWWSPDFFHQQYFVTLNILQVLYCSVLCGQVQVMERPANSSCLGSWHQWHLPCLASVAWYCKWQVGGKYQLVTNSNKAGTVDGRWWKKPCTSW